MKKSLVFLLFILLNSCTPLMKVFWGLRESKPEDKKSLTKYLKRKHMTANDVLVYSDSISYKQLFKSGFHDFPELKVFNKQGSLVYYRDTSGTCSGPAYEYTEVICSSTGLRSNNSKTLDAEIINLVTLDNQPAVIPNIGQYDYYVFIYWMRPLGRLNKTKVRVWENNLKHVSGCKVWVSKVNIDEQKRWFKKK